MSWFDVASSFAFGTLAQVTPGQPLAGQPTGGPPVVQGAQLESVWDFVVKGGPTMVAIGACSLVALTVIVERLVVLRRRAIIPAGFVEGLLALAADRDKALAYCDASGSPAARVLRAAIARRGEPIERVEKAVGEVGRRELIRMRHRMRVMGALPQVSTMLGLLGTIFGMIKTFQAVAASGQALGKTELLAKGIFEAWTCTAAGLLVAIPVLVAYHALMGRIDARLVDLDRLAEDWVSREEGRERVADAIAQASAPAPQPAARRAATAPSPHTAASTPIPPVATTEPA